MAGSLCVFLFLLVAVELRNSVSADVKANLSLKELQERVEKLENEMKKEILVLREQVNINRSKIVAYAETVFLATIGRETLSVEDEASIIWDKVPINPGGHYSTVTGGYTAPFSGYYQFSVTKRSDDYQADFSLLIDEVRHFYSEIDTGAPGDGSGNSPTNSATINVELTAGQVVKVENDNSAIVYRTISGVVQSWFTGHILYAL